MQWDKIMLLKQDASVYHVFETCIIITKILGNRFHTHTNIFQKREYELEKHVVASTITFTANSS